MFKKLTKGIPVTKTSKNEKDNKDSKGSKDAKNKSEKKPGDKYQSKAKEYLNDPEKTEDLLRKAQEKMKGKDKRGPLKEVWESLSGLCRLVKAYVTGTYREIPWLSIVMIVASIVYFVVPVDAIPDFIAGLGFADDAAVLGYTVKTFRDDIEAFIEWEDSQAGKTA